MKLSTIKTLAKQNNMTEKLYNFIKYIGIKYFYLYTLKKKFYDTCGYRLNLEDPKTFSEKIQWIKVNIHDDNMTICADKLSVKSYVQERVKEIYIPRVYGQWKNANDIEFDKLPNKFVLKSNHGSGEIIIVKDKSLVNLEKIRKEAQSWLKYNYYYRTGEWVYKNIVPTIFAEELLEDEIIDYKIFCFNGVARYILLSKALTEDISKQKREFIWCNWEKTPFTWNGYKKNDYEFKKPDNWNDMIRVAEDISKNFLFCRVDLYNIKGKGIVLSELTFYPSGGFGEYIPVEWETRIGEWLKLPLDKSEVG